MWTSTTSDPPGVAFSEADAFEAAIKFNRDDDAPKLIYADWLAEHPERPRAIDLEVGIRWCVKHRKWPGASYHYSAAGTMLRGRYRAFYRKHPLVEDSEILPDQMFLDLRRYANKTSTYQIRSVSEFTLVYWLGQAFAFRTKYERRDRNRFAGRSPTRDADW